ncbi:glycosyltransferase [Candidatus Uhrbacteria bacterium]|nr:glycosyltransferase [Candidatus Uhrbacteria bacterium]
MKIVLIASLYRPYSRGGAEVVFQMVVDELKKHHDVVVVSTCQWRGFRSLIPRMTQEEGVRVYRFFPLNIFSFITLLHRPPIILRALWYVFDTFSIHSYWVIRSLLKKERPDGVMTHNLKGIGLTVPRAIAASRIPHIHTVHDIGLVYPSGILLHGEESTLANRCMAFVSGAITRRLFGSPPAVIFASRFLKDFYARHAFFPRSRGAVIQNPIQQNGVLAREHPSINDDGRTTVAFVGQLEPHKGIEFLLRAWENWGREDARLNIAGKGSVEARVRQAAARDSRITYAGYCQDVPSFLADTSFVIVPSLCYENAPMIIFESGALGIPVIAPSIGGIAEYIEEGVNGFLFTPSDERSLIEALERATAVAPEIYEVLSKNAKNSVRDYTVQRYCERLEEVSTEASGVLYAR